MNDNLKNLAIFIKMRRPRTSFFKLKYNLKDRKFGRSIPQLFALDL